MRFKIDVAANDVEMPWVDVHGPARAVLYALIRSRDPVLAGELHDRGWRGSSLRPIGMSPPLFAGATRRKGAYALSDRGTVWLGSPVPEIAAGLLAGVAGRQELRWGRTRLRVKGVQLDPTPEHNSGEAVFSTVSPVLVKHEDRYILPDDDHYKNRLRHNIRHKADLLGVPGEVEVEVLDAGPRRLFRVQGAPRVGASIRVRLAGAPALLGSLADWGLGLGTNQGFGWVQ